MTTVRDRTHVPPDRVIDGSPALDDLRRELQELGLRPYAARVLLGLLCAGSANSAQLALMSGVPRTSIYQVMEVLDELGLAEQLPTHGPAVWTCRGWEAVVDVLDAHEEERLRRHHARTRQLRQDLAELLPPQATPA